MSSDVATPARRIAAVALAAVILTPTLLFAQSPWERAASNLEAAFTGTLARSLALVAIVIGGLMFMFGEHRNDQPHVTEHRHEPVQDVHLADRLRQGRRGTVSTSGTVAVKGCDGIWSALWTRRLACRDDGRQAEAGGNRDGSGGGIPEETRKPRKLRAEPDEGGDRLAGQHREAVADRTNPPLVGHELENVAPAVDPLERCTAPCCLTCPWPRRVRLRDSGAARARPGTPSFLTLQIEPRTMAPAGRVGDTARIPDDTGRPGRLTCHDHGGSDEQRHDEAYDQRSGAEHG